MKCKLFKGLLVFLMLMISASVSAYDFKVDGIYYDITNTTKNEVAVTCGTLKTYDGTDYSDYNGDVIIPSLVTHGNITYTVSSIGPLAFLGCPGVTSITIPNSVTTIGYFAFSGCI